MKITFNEFVHKKCDLMDPNVWSTQKEEHQLVATNNELMRRHFYQELPHVSSYMEEHCGNNSWSKIITFHLKSYQNVHLEFHGIKMVK